MSNFEHDAVSAAPERHSVLCQLLVELTEPKSADQVQPTASDAAKWLIEKLGERGYEIKEIADYRD